MRYLVSILILLTGLSVSAELYRQKTEAPFLYAIQKDGKTSFILGSQHIGIQLNQLPEYVVDFIKRKKLLIGEVRIENSFVHITYHPEFKNDLPDSIREGLKRRGFSDFVIDHADQKEF